MEWNRGGNGPLKAVATPSSSFSPAQAYWNHRSTLSAIKERILLFSHAADTTTYLSVCQLTQLLAAALEFAPDLILELGRARGNSTCAFTEAANQLGLGPRRVLSFDLTDWWEQMTVPRLKGSVPESWFAPLAALQENILTFDFHSSLVNANRVLVFWDAHGFDVAECVLGMILPELANRPHVVLMHDLSDSRYLPAATFEYGENGLWKETDYTGPRLKLGNIDSAVEEVIALVDFATRNRLPLHSADHSFHSELGSDPARCAELKERLGELFSLQADWFYFSLGDAPGRLTFPKFKPPSPDKTSAQDVTESLAGLSAHPDLSKYDETPVDPKDIQLLQASSLRSTEWPVVVQTPVAPWSYAAILPIRSYAGSGGVGNAIIRIRAKAVQGELWVGALTHDEKSFVNLCLVPEGPDSCETLLDGIDLNNVSKIVIRNGARSGSGSVTIESASILVPK